jgi:hypothetical protein
MKSCESYEIDLSSLLDGEAAPEIAAAAVEHALGCADCAAFFRAARRLDSAARPLADDPADADAARAEALWLAIRGRAGAGSDAVGRPPARWRALRAAALVAVGLGGGYWLSSVGATASGVADRRGDRPVAARTDGAPAAMDERRFVALAGELLAADLRYQRAMLDVLALVPALDDAEVGGDDESRPVVRAARREDGPRAGLL